jgi:WD40 repeat protein
MRKPNRAFLAESGKSVSALAFSPDGKLLAAGSESGELRLFRMSDGTLTSRRELGGTVRDIAFSPDGKQLAAAGDFGLAILSATSGLAPKSKLVTGKVMMAVSFDQKGKHLASGGRDRKVTVWKTPRYQRLRQLGGHTSWVSALAFSPNGKVVYSGGWDNTVVAHELPTGSRRWICYCHKFAVNSVEPHPNGKLLLTSSDDRRMKLVRVSDGKILKTRRVGAGTGLALIAGSSIVAVSTWRGRIKLLTVPKGGLVSAIRAAAGPIRSFTATSDGSLVAAGGSHGSIKVWKIPDRCWPPNARKKQIEPAKPP